MKNHDTAKTVQKSRRDKPIDGAADKTQNTENPTRILVKRTEIKGN